MCKGLISLTLYKNNMTNKIIQVKQKANLFAKSLNLDKDFTTHPDSVRCFYPRLASNGDWITGLSEKEAEEYGKKLKKDLSPTSDFWESLEIKLVNKSSEVTFNLDNPMQFVMYKCSIGNKFLANNIDELREPAFYSKDSFLYVFDPEGDLIRDNNLRELRAENTSLLFQMKGQKEKMFYILAKTGAAVHETWTVGILYKNLSLYLDGLKKEEHLEKFRDLLKDDNDKLQVEYLVNKSFGNAITIINGQWIFGNTNLGSTKEQAIKTFIKKSELFVLLQEEVGILL